MDHPAALSSARWEAAAGPAGPGPIGAEGAGGPEGARNTSGVHQVPPDGRPPRGLQGLVPLVRRAPEDRAAVPVGGGRAWAEHPAAPSSARLQAAAGPAGPGPTGRRTGLWCPWVAAEPGQVHAHQVPPDWRPSRGLQGLAGLRDDAPSEARGADGERAGRPRGGQRSGGRARRRPEHRRSTPNSPTQQAGKPPLTLRRRRVLGVPCS